MKLYKILDETGMSCHGGQALWDLPTYLGGKWHPGDWMTPVRGELIPCKNGYHLIDADHLIDWLGRTIYAVECGNDWIKGNEWIIVARTARLLRRVDTWDEHTARLFAVWCAREAIAKIDNAPRLAIDCCDAVERLLCGVANRNEIHKVLEAIDDYIKSDFNRDADPIHMTILDMAIRLLGNPWHAAIDVPVASVNITLMAADPHPYRCTSNIEYRAKIFADVKASQTNKLLSLLGLS